MILCVTFLVFLALNEVTTQVCYETLSVLREINQTYQYTYYEAYEAEDCLYWCIKSKMAVNVGTRQVKQLVNETVSVCCDGYTLDDDYEGDGIRCIPVCNPPCENGYCRNPNECACESGYAVDTNDILSRCKPLCLEGCGTPNCLSTCDAPRDYDYDTPESDMCDGDCINGTCVASGVCHCNPGFKRVLRSCEPICTSCEHGTCVAPEQCKCDFGWREECGSCKPICSGCEHGECRAPGQCECDPGYKAINAKCEPYCPKCSGGICVAPDLCACEAGWYMDKVSSKCEPHCDVACGNGSCVAPNFCACYKGYRPKSLLEGDEAPRCMPKCTNCDGICVAPDTCECEEDFEHIYTTVDGKECDCFDCDDSAKKCEKIICRRKSYEDDVGKIIVTSEETAALPDDTEEAVSMGLANTTINDITNSMNVTYDNSKTEKFAYHWIYIAIIVIESLLIIIMLVILERKHLLDRLKTKKFVPRDKHDEVSVHYTSSVTCHKIKDKIESE